MIQRRFVIIFICIIPFSIKAREEKIKLQIIKKIFLNKKRTEIRKVLVPLIASLELTPFIYTTLTLMLGSLATLKPEETPPKPPKEEDF